MDSEPVAPAGLYIDPKSGNESFQLHKLIGCEDLVFHFETYNSNHPLPNIGEVFSYRGWWLPEAMEAALDTEAVWEHRTYPDNGGHDHCLFTWKELSSCSPENAGWWSESYGWVTEKAYADYILKDVYNLRATRNA